MCVLTVTLGVFLVATVYAGNGNAPVYDDDYVWVTNQDGKFVDESGCELTLTNVDSSGDPDFQIWQCLENNSNPGVDQRIALKDTNGNPITTQRCVENCKKHKRDHDNDDDDDDDDDDD
jgi:hypothetical protein